MFTFEAASNIPAPKFRLMLRDLALQAETIGFALQGNVLKAEVEALLQQISCEALVDDYCDRWPGTTLLMGQARVLEFRATAEIIDLIADFAGGLFDTGHDPSSGFLHAIRHDHSAGIDISRKARHHPRQHCKSVAENARRPRFPGRLQIMKSA